MPNVIIKRSFLDDSTCLVTVQGRSRGRMNIEHFVEGLISSVIESRKSTQYNNPENVAYDSKTVYK